MGRHRFKMGPGQRRFAKRALRPRQAIRWSIHGLHLRRRGRITDRASLTDGGAGGRWSDGTRALPFRPPAAGWAGIRLSARPCAAAPAPAVAVSSSRGTRRSVCRPPPASLGRWHAPSTVLSGRPRQRKRISLPNACVRTSPQTPGCENLRRESPFGRARREGGTWPASSPCLVASSLGSSSPTISRFGRRGP